jgi:hypothetical protein
LLLTIGRQSRLAVHTLLREDLFAGVLTNDMERLTRGEKNLERLLTERPQAKAGLMGWKGMIAVYRAVVASEKNQKEEFDRQYRLGLEMLGEAKRLAPADIGVAAITGGTLVIFGDRLPQAVRPAAYAQAMPTRSCGSSRARRWKNFLCILKENCSLALHRAHSAQAARRRPRNSWTRS